MHRRQRAIRGSFSRSSASLSASSAPSSPSASFARKRRVRRPVLYSIEVRNGAGDLLASPMLIGEEGRPLHLDLSQEAGPHSEPLAMSLDLNPRADGNNLCVGYRLSIDDGFPHSGRLGVAWGAPRSVRLSGGGEDLRLSLVVARAHTRDFGPHPAAAPRTFRLTVIRSRPRAAAEPLPPGKTPRRLLPLLRRGLFRRRRGLRLRSAADLAAGDIGRCRRTFRTRGDLLERARRGDDDGGGDRLPGDGGRPPGTAACGAARDGRDAHRERRRRRAPARVRTSPALVAVVVTDASALPAHPGNLPDGRAGGPQRFRAPRAPLPEDPRFQIEEPPRVQLTVSKR